MPTDDYVTHIEKENDAIRKKLMHYETLRDIIAARVSIDHAAVLESLDPMLVCEYAVKMGWTLNYEKPHERYLTRSYYSPHRDTKCKLYIQDFSPQSKRYNGVSEKLKDTIKIFARIHKKGELEVIYEIITGDIKQENA